MVLTPPPTSDSNSHQSGRVSCLDRLSLIVEGINNVSPTGKVNGDLVGHHVIVTDQSAMPPGSRSLIVTAAMN
jgi:hypothetical protein